MVFQCRPLFEHRFIGISLHSSITKRFLSFFQIHDSLLSDLVVPWYLVHSPLWFLFTLCLVACHNICTNVCIETVLPANCEPGFRLFTNCKRRSILLVSFNKCWTQFQIRVKCVKFFPECMAVFFPYTATRPYESRCVLSSEECSIVCWQLENDLRYGCSVRQKYASILVAMGRCVDVQVKTWHMEKNVKYMKY